MDREITTLWRSERACSEDRGLVIPNAPESRVSPGELIVGGSQAVRGALRDISLLAPTDVPVLLLGDTGTGKELFARAIHRSSHRASKPMVRLDCASLTSSLCESELYGHAHAGGAFTGGVERHVARIRFQSLFPVIASSAQVINLLDMEGESK